jgi:glutamine synthetase type III
MVDLIQQHVIPSLRAAASACIPGQAAAREEDSTPNCHAPSAESTSIIAQLQRDVTALQAALEGVHRCEDAKEQGQLARVLRLETMGDIRATVDAAEAVVPAHLWTLATYKELLFMDQHHVA